MAPRRPSPAQIRDRRARTAVVVLGGVLVLVGVIQGPKILSLIQGSGSSGTTSSGVAGATPAGSTAPGATVSFSSATAAGPVAGQLDGFSLLAPKDPFHSQLPVTPSPSLVVVPTPAPAKPVAKQPPVGVSAAAISPAGALQGASTPVAATVLAAVVKMNGHKQVVVDDGRFPLASPLFEVVSVGKLRATLRLVTGSFADGSRNLRLRRGHKLTLLNTTDGSRYALVFVERTRTAPVVPAAPASSQSGAPAAPASTSSGG